MKLPQVSPNLSGDVATKGLASVLEKYPILRIAEFSMDTFSYQTYPEVATPEGNTARQIDDPNLKAVYAPNSGSETQRAYGIDLEIDKAYANDSNVTGASTGLIRRLRSRQKSGFLKVAGDVVNHMFSGTGVAPYIIGLAEFIKDATADAQTARFGFTGADLAAMNKRFGLQLSIDDLPKLRQFVEVIRMVKASVPGANALVMNEYLYPRMCTIADIIGAAGMSQDNFGQPIKTFDTVPMITVPTTAIPMTESDGENQDCTSLYVIRYEEETGVCYATNSGLDFVDFENMESKPSGKSRIDFIANLKIQDNTCVKRVSRIRI